MSGLTTDPADPRLTHGADQVPVDQAEVYLVLDEAERAKGFVRPLRRSYRHRPCGQVTTMAAAIAETYARDPGFYGATYCTTCHRHLPVAQFTWLDGAGRDTTDPVGS